MESKLNVVLNLVKERRIKLLADNEFLGREVAVKTQRLEDIKATMSANSFEIAQLDSILWSLDTNVEEAADDIVVEPPAPKQNSGPQCRNCGAVTTYARVESHGLCMKCENDGMPKHTKVIVG